MAQVTQASFMRDGTENPAQCRDFLVQCSFGYIFGVSILVIELNPLFLLKA